MTPSLPAALYTATNRAVLAHVDERSAHSDIGDALVAALRQLGDVQIHCRDWQQCRAVLAATGNVIFGVAIGMNTIAFRLDQRMQARALASGGAAYPECGAEWVSFVLFRDDWPKVDVEFWALKAYVDARSDAG